MVDTFDYLVGGLCLFCRDDRTVIKPAVRSYKDC